MTITREERRLAVNKEGPLKPDLRGLQPESWLCIDCGVNTAPGSLNRDEMERALAAAKLRGEQDIKWTIDDRSERYTVRDAVWKKAGMAEMGGCLCISCLEKRIGRRLKPKDFPRHDPLNELRLPGTPRLLSRRG